MRHRVQSIFLISLCWPKAPDTFLFNIWAELCSLDSLSQNISLFITQFAPSGSAIPGLLPAQFLPHIAHFITSDNPGDGAEEFRGLDKGLSPVVHSLWFVYWDIQGCSFSSVFLISCPKVGEKCS